MRLMSEAAQARALSKLLHSRAVLPQGAGAAAGAGRARGGWEVHGDGREEDPVGEGSGGNKAARAARKREEEDQDEVALQASEPGADAPHTPHASLSAACAAGDWRFVESALAGGNAGALLAGNPDCLLLACSYGRARVVEQVLRFCGSALVNGRDASGTTPLLALCRARASPVSERLRALRALLARGAAISVADKAGDTCLHWLARTRDATMASALLRLSGEAMLLVERRNARGRSPVDVARARPAPLSAAETRSAAAFCLAVEKAHASGEAQRRLLWHRAARSEAEAERRRLDRVLDALVADEALALGERVAKLCREQYLAAEMERRDAEKEHVNAAVSQATGAAKAWLQGPYGSNELKTLAKTIASDLHDKLGEAADEEAVAKEAKDKAALVLLKRKQNEARAKAVAEFRDKNPPLQQ
jgi:hypothetical protein